MFEIEIKGLEKVQNNLKQAGYNLPIMLNNVMLKAVLLVHSKIPSYPPPPPASTYVRTGMLGRSITTLKGSDPHALSEVKSLGSEVRGIIGTNISYGPYVIDKTRQAKVHQGRWWTLQDTVLGLKDEITTYFKQQVDAFVHKFL